MTEKLALITAYSELSQALVKTSAAISDFTHLLAATTNPNEVAALMEGVPAQLPFFASITGKSSEAPAEKGKKAKKEKKIKDPNAPKRPPSAYLEFQNSVRAKFRDEEPNLSYQDVLRKISAVWSGMPDDEKKLWQDITSEKSATYEKDKATYEAEHPPEAGDATMTDITVDGATPAKTLGKDGKEYTGKKRGRKSAADKLREADEALGATDSATLQAIALAVENTPKDKKKKDKKEAAPKATVPIVSVPITKAPKTPKSASKVAAAPAPAEESDDDDSDEDSDEDDSEESDEDSDEDEATPAASTSALKDKRKGEDKVEKPKSKKSKTA